MSFSKYVNLFNYKSEASLYADSFNDELSIDNIENDERQNINIFKALDTDGNNTK